MEQALYQGCISSMLWPRNIFRMFLGNLAHSPSVMWQQGEEFLMHCILVPLMVGDSKHQRWWFPWSAYRWDRTHTQKRENISYFPETETWHTEKTWKQTSKQFLPLCAPDDIAGIVVGDAGAPTDPDSLGAVDQDHRKDGAIPRGASGSRCHEMSETWATPHDARVPLWFNGQAFFLQVWQDVILGGLGHAVYTPCFSKPQVQSNPNRFDINEPECHWNLSKVVSFWYKIL